MELNGLSGTKVEMEKACYSVLVRWHRKQLFEEWLNALTPRIYPAKPNEEMSIIGQLCYLLAILVLLPFSFTVWVLELLYASIRFPFILIGTWIPPRSYAVGERNIQGIHNAFVKYGQLDPENYIQCVDEWIEILYGPKVRIKYSFTDFIDHTLIRKMRGLYEDDMEAHYGRILSNARERFTKKFGNY